MKCFLILVVCAFMVESKPNEEVKVLKRIRKDVFDNIGENNVKELEEALRPYFTEHLGQIAASLPESFFDPQIWEVRLANLKTALVDIDPKVGAQKIHAMYEDAKIRYAANNGADDGQRFIGASLKTLLSSRIVAVLAEQVLNFADQKIQEYVANRTP